MISKFSFLTSSVILLGAICFFYLLISRPAVVVVVDKRLDQFPENIGKYTSEDIKMSDSIVNELNTDVFVYRNYTGRKGPIALYIGYYGTQKGGRTGHNPNSCYPSSGYAIISESKIKIPVEFVGRKVTQVKVTRLLITKNNEQQIVYHWYQSAENRILASGIDQNIHRFKSLLHHNRNDGAFIRLSALVLADIAQTEEGLIDFSGKIIPLIEQYWPIEQEENVQ